MHTCISLNLSSIDHTNFCYLYKKGQNHEIFGTEGSVSRQVIFFNKDFICTLCPSFLSSNITYLLSGPGLAIKNIRYEQDLMLKMLINNKNQVVNLV